MNKQISNQKMYNTVTLHKTVTVDRLLNECYKYKMDLTTNGVVITDVIKFVQTNKEKLMTSQKAGHEESKEPDHEDKDQLEEKQEEETREQETTNHIS